MVGVNRHFSLLLNLFSVSFDVTAFPFEHQTKLKIENIISNRFSFFHVYGLGLGLGQQLHVRVRVPTRSLVT